MKKSSTCINRKNKGWTLFWELLLVETIVENLFGMHDEVPQHLKSNFPESPSQFVMPPIFQTPPHLNGPINIMMDSLCKETYIWYHPVVCPFATSILKNPRGCHRIQGYGASFCNLHNSWCAWSIPWGRGRQHSMSVFFGGMGLGFPSKWILMVKCNWRGNSLANSVHIVQ